MPPPQNNEAQDSNEFDNISMAVFNSAKNYLLQKLPVQLSKPKVAIICGSGLGGLADSISSGSNNNDYDSKSKKRLDGDDAILKIEFKYEDIPGFVNSTVAGHEGKLVFGLIGKVPVICMVGRFHFYEGHDLKQVTFPIRVFKLIGVETLIVTNATGSLNSEKFKVGDIGVIIDHISLPGLTGTNPLIGPNLNIGPRFIPMSDAYDYELREKAFKAANILNFSKGSIKEVVYCYVCGPTYETRAEAKFLKFIGGDVVGMSTVPEVIVARHCGLRVLGLSLVTNKVAMSDVRSADPSIKNVGVYDEFIVNHEEVLETGKAKAKEMQQLVKKIIELL